ncbi:MAG: DUF4867 family protein, partial [Lachnospiraceae bacterium]|nr:DUF4867 family protein [Lachnospiraceae bacterium]
DGKLDTAKVKAFKAPVGVLIECYATTLHYAPCSAKVGQGFRVLVGIGKESFVLDTVGSGQDEVYAVVLIQIGIINGGREIYADPGKFFFPADNEQITAVRGAAQILEGFDKLLDIAARFLVLRADQDSACGDGGKGIGGCFADLCDGFGHDGIFIDKRFRRYQKQLADFLLLAP